MRYVRLDELGNIDTIHNALDTALEFIRENPAADGKDLRIAAYSVDDTVDAIDFSICGVGYGIRDSVAAAHKMRLETSGTGNKTRFNLILVKLGAEDIAKYRQNMEEKK